MSEEEITVYRLLKYEGPRSWVEKTLEQSYIRPTLSKRTNPTAAPNTTLVGEITEIFTTGKNA